MQTGNPAAQKDLDTTSCGFYCRSFRLGTRHLWRMWITKREARIRLRCETFGLECVTSNGSTGQASLCAHAPLAGKSRRTSPSPPSPGAASGGLLAPRALRPRRIGRKPERAGRIDHDVGGTTICIMSIVHIPL